MGSFGQRLQREREMRGITLEEIATSTKIGTRSLRALEEEDFEQLPGGIFNKGFVRAYAKYLGIDEEQAVTDYLLAAGEGEQPLPNPTVKAEPEYSTIRERSNSGAWVAIALLILLGAGGYYGWRWYEQTKETEHEMPAAIATPTPPPAADSTAASASDATTTTTPGGANAPELSTPAAAGFLLEIRAKKDAWISYTADDSPAREVQMKSTDETVAIRAQKKIKLVLGNAGGVEISHNGKTLPQLGPENKARTVVFTPSGLER
jgi:cytoskeleton protein RodZ